MIWLDILIGARHNEKNLGYIGQIEGIVMDQLWATFSVIGLNFSDIFPAPVQF